MRGSQRAFAEKSGRLQIGTSCWSDISVGFFPRITQTNASDRRADTPITLKRLRQ